MGSSIALDNKHHRQTLIKKPSGHQNTFFGITVIHDHPGDGYPRRPQAHLRTQPYRNLPFNGLAQERRSLRLQKQGNGSNQGILSVVRRNEQLRIQGLET